MISDEIKKDLKEIFQGSNEPVSLVFINREAHSEEDEEIRELLKGLGEFLDFLEVTILTKEEASSQNFEVTNTPIFLFSKKGQDPVFHYLGIPNHYEFQTLIYGIQLLAKEKELIHQPLRDSLMEIESVIHIDIFVTPT